MRVPNKDVTRTLTLPGNEVLVRIPTTLLPSQDYGPGARHVVHITVGVAENTTGVTRHNITLVQGEEVMGTNKIPTIGKVGRSFVYNFDRLELGQGPRSITKVRFNTISFLAPPPQTFLYQGEVLEVPNSVWLEISDNP